MGYNWAGIGAALGGGAAKGFSDRLGSQMEIEDLKRKLIALSGLPQEAQELYIKANNPMATMLAGSPLMQSTLGYGPQQTGAPSAGKTYPPFQDKLYDPQDGTVMNVPNYDMFKQLIDAGAVLKWSK